MSTDPAPDTALSQRPIGSTVRLTDQELTEAADLIETGDGDLIADEVILALIGEVRAARAPSGLAARPMEDDAYYVMARDSDGHIRANNGGGLLVARRDDGIATVQGWVDRAGSDHHRRLYAAALDLLISEGGS